ncbi:hypothetical protein [Janthinobacterium sp. P210005]|uniref:hypothetical protein n=1 Tax=Janthinobacterium sp. P210005 TaxID=3112938 RepID=UPI002E253A35|nr:hypothetical protein [Janthinobacterium sp. P210005]
MQIISLIIWLGLLFTSAKIVNYFAKRPMLNPWVWLAASYALFYILGLFFGLARHAPNLAYTSGYFLPITFLAVVIGIWRAPKWRAAQLALPRNEAVEKDE